MELGKEEKVWNYVVTDFQYTGGAHPNTFVKCLNIDRETGQLLTTEKVFKKEASAKICPLILDELIKEVNAASGVIDGNLSSSMNKAGVPNKIVANFMAKNFQKWANGHKNVKFL